MNNRDLDNHIQVLLVQTCNSERIDEQDVECLNVEEDIQGRDIVTFKCPECGTEHKSVRLG